MSNAQNLAYSVVQVLHNFGAVAAVGGSLAAIRLASAETRRKLAWLTLAGWGVQAASGAAFGMASYLFYHRLPDIAGIAVAALAVKIACAASGFLIVAAYLLRGAGWNGRVQTGVWHASLALAATALAAAAFLRWFS